MKNCQRRARPVVVRDCDTGLYAASAREKAIAYLSTDTRPQCNSKGRSDGNARAQRRILGILAEHPAASHRGCPAALPAVPVKGPFADNMPRAGKGRANGTPLPPDYRGTAREPNGGDRPATLPRSRFCSSVSPQAHHRLRFLASSIAAVTMIAAIIAAWPVIKEWVR